MERRDEERKEEDRGERKGKERSVLTTALSACGDSVEGNQL